jgi:hypothetical protein
VQSIVSKLQLRERTLLFLAMSTGLRRGELAGLKWQDVAFDRMLLFVERSVVDQVVGCPSGRCAQKTLHLLGSEDQKDRIHQGSLAHTGATGDDGGTAGQNGLQRLPLAWCQRLAGPLLAPRDDLFDIDRWVGRISCSQPPDLPQK